MISLSECNSRYMEYLNDLINYDGESGFPRFATSFFVGQIADGVPKSTFTRLYNLYDRYDGKSIIEYINAQRTVSSRNAARERVVAEVIIPNPFCNLSDKQIKYLRRPLISVTASMQAYIEDHRQAVIILEQELAPSVVQWLQKYFVQYQIELPEAERTEEDEDRKLLSVAPFALKTSIDAIQR